MTTIETVEIDRELMEIGPNEVHDTYYKWSLTICDGCFDTLKSSKM